jgi:transposase
LLSKPATTEKTDKVLEKAGLPSEANQAAAGKADQKTPRETRRGQGRNGAKAYTGARRVAVPHASLSSGDRCPKCLEGTPYAQRDPGILIRVVGQAPLVATIYELEELRCGLCLEVLTAAAPPEAGDQKYDETAASMIAVLKYGSGVPFLC